MIDSIDLERSREPGRGREAARPRAIPLEGWKDIGWRLFWSVLENRVMLIAAGVTYYSLLAMVPALNCFVVLYGLFNSPAQVVDQVDLLSGILPEGGLEILREQLIRLTSEDRGTLSLTFLVSLVIALWSAGAGFRALFEAMNAAYKENEKRNIIEVNLLALGFTVAGTIAAIIVITTVVVIPPVLRAFAFGGSVDWLVRVASYGAMLAVLVIGLAALYRLGPSRQDARWRWIAPGNILAIVGVIVVSVLFSWYAANFADFGATYGSLGALVGFLTWVWLSMTMVILGAALNAETEHQTARDTTTGPEMPMGVRGAHVADTVAPARPGARHVARPHRPILGGWVLLLPLVALAAAVAEVHHRRGEGE